ncbi:MAG: zinc-dependent alcohol dehydrogenase family protein [Dermatophilaceae bacterium]
MRAWSVRKPGPIDEQPMRLVTRPIPTPGIGEVLLRVDACGVCRTDLHVAEGDLSVHLPNVTPGHEVVGTVVELGPGAERFELGDRVGIAWLRHTCGVCRPCRRGNENLCGASQYTGWDAHGGYAEYAVAPQAFGYRLPADLDPVSAAPLLCAGIIGYRALRRAQLPPGGTLGLYGFGGSAHLTAQIALAQGARVHVVTRSPAARALSLRLGASSAVDDGFSPPEPLDSAIIFAPAGELVPLALAALAPGGTLALAGIHMSDVPAMNYQAHLFRERTLTSVESNTRLDGEELFTLAARLGVRAQTTTYPLERADRALADLAHDRVTGAAVLVP